MTRTEAGRYVGLLRAARLSPEERREQAERANVSRSILVGLGKSNGRPSTSPFEAPCRVVRSERI
jgi:hypothetical protein